jgi:hypothetical protein
MTPQQKYYLKNRYKQSTKQKLNYKQKKFGLIRQLRHISLLNILKVDLTHLQNALVKK